MKNVKEYEKYFQQTYDERPLLLYPMNEANVEKFISSFIRPTKTGYVELFDHIQCAEYISNFVVYEELESSENFPPMIVSPYNIIRWQAGDSSELAILYASLLIGVGYDAFVVIGNASIDITRKNEGNVAFNLLNSKESADDNKGSGEKWGLGNPTQVVENMINKQKKAHNPYKKPVKERHASQIVPGRGRDSKSRETKARKTQKSKGPQNNGSSKFTTQNLGNGTTNANNQNSNQKQFFKFDVVKEDDETPIEGQLFGVFDIIPIDEDNPYYIPINKASKTDKIAELKNKDDIFHKNANKYNYTCNLKDKFNEFLADDEPMRILTNSIANNNKLLHNNIQKNKSPRDDYKLVLNEHTEVNINFKLEEVDDNEDRQLHFWVLVRSSEQRELPFNIFVDPASGRHWNINTPALPFFSIKQIFNNRNVWINLNEDLQIHQLDFNSFDDYENEDFEFVLDEQTAQSNQSCQDEDIGDDPNQATFSPFDSHKAKNSLINFTGLTAVPIFNPMSNTFSNNTNTLLKSDSNKIESNKSQLKVNKLVVQSLAERITSNEELFQRPSSWVPKLELEKELFLCRYAGSRQRKFYQKCQVDFFSRGCQSDGLVKRVQIYMDLKREYLYEIRTYYKDRVDRMYMKKEFPFEFRSVESFSIMEGVTAPNPSIIVPHWREIERFMGRKNIFRFYSMRFFDGLIEREEIIGEKTIERYENRDDRLVYMSVRFELATGECGNKELYCYQDRNVDDVKILKMVQKYDKNSFMTASNQIAKIIFDLSRNIIRVIYHMEEHQIAPVVYEISRTAFSKIMSHNDKSKIPLRNDQQKIQQLYALEKDCFSKIKKSEDSVEKEIKNFKTIIEETGVTMVLKNYKNTHRTYAENLEGMDKTNGTANKENVDENGFVDEADDYVIKALRKRGLLGQKIDPKMAEEIKFEILSNLQERFVQRAEIIDNRFKEEKNKMKAMQKKFQKKTTENGSFTDEKDFEEELYQYNLKLGILETRLFNFQKIAFEKYEDMQRKLAVDPRLLSYS